MSLVIAAAPGAPGQSRRRQLVHGPQPQSRVFFSVVAADVAAPRRPRALRALAGAFALAFAALAAISSFAALAALAALAAAFACHGSSEVERARLGHDALGYFAVHVAQPHGDLENEVVPLWHQVSAVSLALHLEGEQIVELVAHERLLD